MLSVSDKYNSVNEYTREISKWIELYILGCGKMPMKFIRQLAENMYNKQRQLLFTNFSALLFVSCTFLKTNNIFIGQMREVTLSNCVNVHLHVSAERQSYVCVDPKWPQCKVCNYKHNYTWFSVHPVLKTHCATLGNLLFHIPYVILFNLFNFPCV